MNLKVAVAQFEPRDGDKAYNLNVVEKLVAKAKQQGAHMVSFHEMCITAYTFLKDLDEEGIKQLAEPVPDGPSVQRLQELAGKYDVVLLAGLLEEADGRYYNTYVAVDGENLLAKHRKIHPFISRFLSAGDGYTHFEVMGWKCGILICYDNNVVENVRATALQGAELVFAPHVTGCTPSTFPGSGFVEDKLWEQRHDNPEPLRAEFDGPKGRGWLLRWLPARAYDNGVYYAFTNPIGYDGDQLKPGNAMLLDPYGEVISEVRSFEDDVAIATLSKEELPKAGGYRYRNARRPELYRAIIGADHDSNTTPVWLKKKQS